MKVIKNMEEIMFFNIIYFKIFDFFESIKKFINIVGKSVL